MVAQEKGDPLRVNTVESIIKYFNIDVDEARADKYGRRRWLFHLSGFKNVRDKQFNCESDCKKLLREEPYFP
jgi:hypothetical protein